MGKRIFQWGICLVLISITISSCNSVDIEVGCNVGDLIQAFNDANSDSDHTRIGLADDCVYTLTNYDNQIDKYGNPSGLSGNNGFPVITTAITVEGNHATITRSSSAPEMRLFLIDPNGILTLEDMTLENGLVQNGGLDYREGGTILNRGRFNLLRSDIVDSYAEDSGGAIANQEAGTLLISMSTLSSNSSGKDGGAILNLGSLEIREATSFEDNESQERAGAILNAGNMTVSQSEFLGNEAGAVGGAIFAWGQADNSLVEVLFELNQTSSHAGAIYFSGVTFSIADCSFFTNVGNSGGGMVIEDSTGDIAGTTFSGNIALGRGGGMWILPDSDVSIDLTTFTNNHSEDYGGGLHNDNDYTVVVVNNSTFSGNETGGFGGGISNGGRITVRNSTLNDNVSTRGGGIHNYGERFRIINSTVSGNSAQHRGGGISNYGTLEILFATIAFNQSFEGGGVYDNGDSLKIKNSLLSNNTSPTCAVYGTLTTLGDNLDDDGTCRGFTVTGDPFLSSLADNGGPTQTHSFLFSGPALDGVNDCTDIQGGTLIERDQRGESRPFWSQCDLGALEAHFSPIMFEVFVEVENAPMYCYSGPDEDTMMLISYNRGDRVSVRGRNEDGSWLATAGKEGEVEQEICWIPSDGVDSPEPIMNFPVLDYSVHPPEPGLEDDTYNRCELFSPETYSLTQYEIPAGTGDLTLYVFMPEGVWGLEVPVPEDPETWQYQGTLGDYADEECTFEGYAGRVFCRLKVPLSYLGTVREFNLYVNGCLEPIYTHPRVTIPEQVEPEPEEPITCSADLEEADCEAAGGTYYCGSSAACECICP